MGANEAVDRADAANDSRTKNGSALASAGARPHFDARHHDRLLIVLTAILILIAAAGLVLFGIGTADPNHPAHPQAVEDLLPVRTYLRPAASWAVLVVVLLASACLAAIWFIRILSGVRRRIMRLILGGLLLGGAFVAFPVLLFPLVMTLDVGTEVSAGQPMYDENTGPDEVTVAWSTFLSDAQESVVFRTHGPWLMTPVRLGPVR